MEVKCLEIRDEATFIPVICLRPVPTNQGQHYLLRRDGYAGNIHENCVIVIKGQCRGCQYDPYAWGDRTMKTAHAWIEDKWHSLRDGEVIDVQFILGETQQAKESERFSVVASV